MSFVGKMSGTSYRREDTSPLALWGSFSRSRVAALGVDEKVVADLELSPGAEVGAMDGVTRSFVRPLGDRWHARRRAASFQDQPQLALDLVATVSTHVSSPPLQDQLLPGLDVLNLGSTVCQVHLHLAPLRTGC